MKGVRARGKEAGGGDRPSSSSGQAAPGAPEPAAQSRPQDPRWPVPVRPAGTRRGARAARPSPDTPSAVREPGSRCGLRLPATAARSFLQGHCELAEGVEQRAEAAGQTQNHDAQVAPHRPGPSPAPRPPPSSPPPPPRPPGRTGAEGAAARSRGCNKFLLHHRPEPAPLPFSPYLPAHHLRERGRGAPASRQPPGSRDASSAAARPALPRPAPRPRSGATRQRDECRRLAHGCPGRGTRDAAAGCGLSLSPWQGVRKL